MLGFYGSSDTLSISCTYVAQQIALVQCFDHEGHDSLSFVPGQDLCGQNVQLQSTVLRQILNITTTTTAIYVYAVCDLVLLNTLSSVPGIGMSCVDDLLEERAEDLSTDEYYDHNRLDLDREAIPCGVGSVCEGDESNAMCTAFNGTGTTVYCINKQKLYNYTSMSIVYMYFVT